MVWPDAPRRLKAPKEEQTRTGKSEGTNEARCRHYRERHLSGRLDTDGALKIDSEFNKIAEETKNVLVDLSGVTFLASFGIHTLITGAKAAANNGGKMVLLNPQPIVEKVLGVDTVIPIIHDLAAIETVFVA
jgi:anti-anti-sigma factor